MMLRHMGPPMLPTPMNPTFTISSRNMRAADYTTDSRPSCYKGTDREERRLMARNKLHPIPHPPRTPVLGNMLTVDGDAPIQDLMRISREQGPIFWLDMMGQPAVVV